MKHKNWKTIARSEYPWEQEALDYIHERFPTQENYWAWSNFEFMADDGTINEIDLMIACPQGVFLIEIKSWPGDLSGDTAEWFVDHNGRRKTYPNPVILTNRKCKRLKSLLERQKAFKGKRVPFIEQLVFLSHPELVNHLSGNAANYVRQRDSDEAGRNGIMGTIYNRNCPGLYQLHGQAVDKPQIRALVRSMEQAGIRPTQASRRVGDFLLQDLIFDSPLGIYQDWNAEHATHSKTKRVARIYMTSRQASEQERAITEKAAIREFELLERLDHPGILRADPPTDCEYGPVLFLRQPADATRLDHYLSEKGNQLTVSDRIDILRQIGEVIAYAHGRKIIHRSLSPQSILIDESSGKSPKVLISNWLTGARISSGETTLQQTQLSKTIHAGQLVEDASQVYLAPEAHVGAADGGTEMDSFSLGTLSYLLFSGKPPADSVTDLQQKLKKSISGSLNISESVDGAVESLDVLIRFTAAANSGDRISANEFLEQLNELEEELTRPDEDFIDNPLDAKNGDKMSIDLTVIKRLGSGSVSVVFLVKDTNGEERVLKVARSSEYNQRIKSEFHTLELIRDKVRSRIVVAPFELFQLGELTAFTMEPAGQRTVASHLKEFGPLDLSYLQRFGDDLLRTLHELDDMGGIAHRDLKPENMGIRVFQGKQNQLCLFDFSLSKASHEDIKVGTPPYLDPFIGERKVKRWDVMSECFSAGMTLHEMTTGVLPQWGDGNSDPASIKDEVSIQPERFDPDLRDRYTAFFTKVLQRDYRQRFDNPYEMLLAWRDIFKTIDLRDSKPKEENAAKKSTKSGSKRTTTNTREFEFDLPELLTPSTQLVLIGLSTRLLNTLDRLNLLTTSDLLNYPLQKILHLRGVGNLTRRELAELFRQLREKLPNIEQGGGAPSHDKDANQEFASVDLIAKQVSTINKGTKKKADEDAIQRFLGWTSGEQTFAPTEWISQSDLGPDLGVSRQRIGQAVVAARARWKRYPSITSLRETILELLLSQGGVVSLEEMIDSILAARGSSYEDPQRSRHASIAIRAAVETERTEKTSRFREFRHDNKILIAIDAELKDYAIALGDVAEKLASEDPLPSPQMATQALHAVSAPTLPEGVNALNDQRLSKLAVSASKNAALSSRLEIYPKGLEAKRALALSQNALFGSLLTVAEIQKRVHARLPEAAAIPRRPKLDKLIDALGVGLKWDNKGADGLGAYTLPGSDGFTLHNSHTLTSRASTLLSSSTSSKPSTPEIEEALEIEEKLEYAAKHGSYLVISFPRGTQALASKELQKRFPVDLCDLDTVFIESMQNQAKTAGADWKVVLNADRSGKGSAEWTNLQMLVERCQPNIREALLCSKQTKLLTNLGLMARYDRLSVLGDLSSEVGRNDAIFGLWALIPANEQADRPMLNRQAIPLANAAQHVRLNHAWLANKHRS